MVAPAPASTVIAADLQEYFTVMQDTTKLSQRRQTTNDILTGINVVFLTAMGAVFVSSHLRSWWVTAIFGAITVFAWLFDITWIRLLNRYAALADLRIRYLSAVEERLRQTGAFVEVETLARGAKQPVRTRGVYALENAVLFKPGNRGGFIRRERFLVLLFMFAFLFVTGIVAGLTQLIAAGAMAPLTL